jgi:CBS domain-containing protein
MPAAKDIMTPAAKVVTAAPTDKAKAVIAALVANKISGMPVVDADGCVVGIITEADVLDAKMTDTVAARIGKKKPITVGPKESLKAVTELLLKKKIKRVAVVDEAGKLMGIVSRADVLKAKVK